MKSPAFRAGHWATLAVVGTGQPPGKRISPGGAAAKQISPSLLYDKALEFSLSRGATYGEATGAGYRADSELSGILCPRCRNRWHNHSVLGRDRIRDYRGSPRDDQARL